MLKKVLKLLKNKALYLFFWLMKGVSEHQQRSYWKQQMLNITGRGGVVVDETGREIVIPGMKVQVCGEGNRIVVSKNIDIGAKHASFAIAIAIHGDNNVVNIGAIGVAHKLTILLGNKSLPVHNVTVEIGDKTGFGSTVIETYNSNSTIKIGQKCMFSEGINIYHTDGHPVYSKDTGKLINQVRTLSIGDHVWVGKDVLFLKNCQIADDCIVARSSVVTKKFTEPGSVIAGNPAAQKKTGITWAATDPVYYENSLED